MKIPLSDGDLKQAVRLAATDVTIQNHLAATGNPPPSLTAISWVTDRVVGPMREDVAAALTRTNLNLPASSQELEHLRAKIEATLKSVEDRFAEAHKSSKDRVRALAQALLSIAQDVGCEVEQFVIRLYQRAIILTVHASVLSSIAVTPAANPEDMVTFIPHAIRYTSHVSTTPLLGSLNVEGVSAFLADLFKLEFKIEVEYSNSTASAPKSQAGWS